MVRNGTEKVEGLHRKKKKQHELTWKTIHTDEREMGKMAERK